MLQDVRALYGNEQSSAEVLVQISHHFCVRFSWARKAALSRGITATVKSLNLFSLSWSHHCDCNYISKLCPTVSSYLPRRGFLFYPLCLADLGSGVGNVPLLLQLTFNTWYQLTKNGTFIHILLLFLLPCCLKDRRCVLNSNSFSSILKIKYTQPTLIWGSWQLRESWLHLWQISLGVAVLQKAPPVSVGGWCLAAPSKNKVFWHGRLEGPSFVWHFSPGLLARSWPGSRLGCAELKPIPLAWSMIYPAKIRLPAVDD